MGVMPIVDANDAQPSKAAEQTTADSAGLSSPSNRRCLVVRLETGEEIINRAEYARRLGITERHVDHLIRARKVDFLRVGAKSIRFRWPQCLESLRG